MLLLSFLTLINSASYAPTWLTSNYIRSANQDLFNTLTGSEVVNTYSFTFSSTLSGIPHLGYGIKSYQGMICFMQVMIILDKKGFRFVESTLQMMLLLLLSNLLEQLIYIFSMFHILLLIHFFHII